jgi:outer membrane protein
MKLKTVLLSILLAVGFSLSIQAQKLAYANIDLVLSLMPETQSMSQSLTTFQKQLAEKLEVKQKYAQAKYQEAEQAAQNNATDAELDKYRNELVRLDGEIRKEAGEADQKLANKRMEMMDPVTKKLEAALKEVAADGGYDYVFNSVDGSGVSIVLHGPEDRDLTKILLTKLGVAIPAGMD